MLRGFWESRAATTQPAEPPPTITKSKIFVLSSTDLNVLDQDIPFLLGADWKEYFLEWFVSSLEGELAKIRITTAIGLSSRFNSVIKRLRLLRRIR